MILKFKSRKMKSIKFLYANQILDKDHRKRKAYQPM